MPIRDRAAQFAPFAALVGYDDAVEETTRVTDDMIEQSEFKEYLYFEERKCQIVCKMHDKYKPIEQHTQEIKELKSYYKNNRHEHKQLSPNGATCRRTS